MTQELLTALGANAEFGMRNSELPVGDGLPDVPQPRSGDRQRAVEGASPYGADPRSPVGALHEAPADTGADPTAGGASPAPTGTDERGAKPTRDVEDAVPYSGQVGSHFMRRLASSGWMGRPLSVGKKTANSSPASAT